MTKWLLSHPRSPSDVTSYSVWNALGPRNENIYFGSWWSCFGWTNANTNRPFASLLNLTSHMTNAFLSNAQVLILLKSVDNLLSGDPVCDHRRRLGVLRDKKVNISYGTKLISLKTVCQCSHFQCTINFCVLTSLSRATSNPFRFQCDVSD